MTNVIPQECERGSNRENVLVERVLCDNYQIRYSFTQNRNTNSGQQYQINCFESKTQSREPESLNKLVTGTDNFPYGGPKSDYWSFPRDMAKQMPFGSSGDQIIFGRNPHSSGEGNFLSNTKSNSNTAGYKLNKTVSQVHFGGERQVYNGDLRNSINRGPVNSNCQHNSGLIQNPNVYGQIGGDQINTSSNMYNCSQKQYRKQKDPDTYDGKHAEWPDNICHFEQVALWNKWSEYEMASQWAMCLRGIARRALSEISRDDLSNYGRLKFSLTQRFCPPERETAYRCEFRNRRRRRDESVSNYGYSLKRLAAHDFPTIPLNIR